MEKIIIYALIIAIGVLYEFFKKRARGNSSRNRVVKSPSPYAPMQSPSPSVKSEYASAPAPQPDSAMKPISAPKPKHTPKPKSILESQPVREQTTVTDTESADRLAGHYAKWRQAIIDAEIIQRKF